MAYYTCNNCNYTFFMKDKPESCPDCGKRTAKRIINNGSCAVESTVPAIRPASDTAQNHRKMQLFRWFFFSLCKLKKQVTLIAAERKSVRPPQNSANHIILSGQTLSYNLPVVIRQGAGADAGCIVSTIMMIFYDISS